MAYEQHLSRGLQSAIDETPIEDGMLRFSVDQARLFLDLGNERIEYTDFVKGLTQEEIFALGDPLPKMYLSSDTHQFMMYHADDWIVFGGASYDSTGQKIDETYVKDVKYNENGILIKVLGNGDEVEISTSEAVAEKIETLETKIQELNDAIEIIKNGG